MEHSTAPKELGRTRRSDPLSRMGKSNSREDTPGYLKKAFLRSAASSHPRLPGFAAELEFLVPREGARVEARADEKRSPRLAGHQACGRPTAAGASFFPPLPALPLRVSALQLFILKCVSRETPRVLQAPRVKRSLTQFLWPYFYLRIHDPPSVTHLTRACPPGGGCKDSPQASTSLSTLSEPNNLLLRSLRAAVTPTTAVRLPCCKRWHHSAYS